MGWFLTPEQSTTDRQLVKDWLRFPELRFLDRFEYIVPLLLALGMYGLGEALAAFAPGLGTGGWQMLVWGFLLSTLCLYHVTYSVNSIAHLFGSRRFATRDDSRNNLWVALFTFGEGWHNNHHRYPASARQGFVWWEIDITYYLLLLLSKLGLVWGLKPVPAYVMAEVAGKDEPAVRRRMQPSQARVQPALTNEES
jgi:stearoyl-CoA desaturase (delta-9 desaturase)